MLYIEAADYTHRRFTPDVYAPIVPLLKAQPYIEDVREWKGEKCDVNLNDMRALAFQEIKTNYANAIRVGLWEWYAKAFGVPEREWQEPWLDNCSKCISDAQTTVIANRCSRYHNSRFPWATVVEKYRPNCLGTIGEEGNIQGTDPKHFVIPPNLLETARIINSGRLFVGNQSCCYSIAEALKKPAILEVWRTWPNCIFNRPYLWHGYDETVHLPNLEELP